ncbi:MAG: UDP-N-acetylmuramoyl-L-alanine--D-glutamate ligase [Acidobacteriaceae bacterium]|nr:UDP-N-acetylmuramoyl-L-alanine--D-glutamate ligase [Acidobacteriaceae bacterium]
MDLRGREVLVVGTKRSGLGAVQLLLEQGARVRAMDAETLAAEEQAKFDRLGVPVVSQKEENLASPDLIVLSPAVPFELPMFGAARRRGIRVIGELELASRFLRGPIIGITGSNGKTTTTALTGHLLRECKIPVQIGGNIGVAVTSLVETSRPDHWNLLEVSSFQLESIEQFRPRIAACLNVTPDHLDRHHDFAGYAAVKMRMFENQQESDSTVMNYDDETCRELYGPRIKACQYWFSSSRRVPAGMWLERDRVLYDGREFMTRSQIRLRGMHNIENVMAAALMAHLAGADLESIACAVETFPGVEHRIEFVRELDGVQYFNDSKATNVDATLKAIDAFDGNLWLILGGKDKGASYEPLVEPLRRKARAALLIGAEPPYPYAAAPLLKKAFDGRVPFADCGTLDTALKYAREHATRGDVVLLSPACASFDQFRSYENRGECFKQLVKELL